MSTCLFLFLCTFINPLHALSSFSLAKKIASHLFQNHRVTLYCRCQYTKSNVVDLSSCNMQLAESIKRAHRVEWEHMMPAENFGKQLRCWTEEICIQNNKRNKGRQCCEKVDSTFNAMEGELYNLWPSVGLVNQARSNYRYGILEEESTFYGCNFKVNSKLRKAEPSSKAKGIVARANLFMAKKYNLNLSASQKGLFEAWNIQYPPSNFEKQWASNVAEIQGYKNPYIISEKIEALN